jgi:hypothetical protein
MTDVQILTLGIALAPSFVAVPIGVLFNNNRLNDIKELLAAKIDERNSKLELLIEKNHSEMLLKFTELDGRLARLEGERRIVS